MKIKKQDKEKTFEYEGVKFTFTKPDYRDSFEVYGPEGYNRKAFFNLLPSKIVKIEGIEFEDSEDEVTSFDVPGHIVDKAGAFYLTWLQEVTFEGSALDEDKKKSSSSAKQD